MFYTLLQLYLVNLQFSVSMYFAMSTRVENSIDPDQIALRDSGDTVKNTNSHKFLRKVIYAYVLAEKLS